MGEENHLSLHGRGAAALREGVFLPYLQVVSACRGCGEPLQGLCGPSQASHMLKIVTRNHFQFHNQKLKVASDCYPGNLAFASAAPSPPLKGQMQVLPRVVN